LTSSDRRSPHPYLFAILFLPFGATAGFVQVTIAYLAHDAGLSDGTVAAMVAINTLPHTWKFAWAPAIDTLWTGKGWYVATNIVSSAAILALGFVPIRPDNVDLLTTIIFVNGLATTFVGMSTEALMANVTAPEDRGRVAGWLNAGNLGGAMVGGLALLLAEHTSVQWLPAAATAVGLLGCSVVLLSIQTPATPSPAPHFLASMRELGRDLKTLLWSRTGAVAVGLCFLPIGSGGAANLFAAMADQWHTSANVVSFSNGVGSGFAAIVGSLLGGRLSDLMERRRAYALSGVVLAIVAFAMALLPHTPVFYVVGVMGYYLALGLCYATFTGFVLEIMGKGAAATKYNIFASLANLPIYLMGILDGMVSDAYGREGMLWFDGAAGVVGAALLLVLVFAVRPRPAPAPAAADEA
jgi:MFS transporter, PAT family, beta-lactamase induction signal transducer AmpG